jgi:hypothetical protein
MKSWRILSSEDEAVWTVIDSKADCDELDGPYKLGTWEVEAKDWYRFLRVQLSDVNHGRSWVMTIAGLEFFGDVMGESVVANQ